MADDIDHAEYDEDGNFLGDSAERMVDTGVPSRRLLKNSSSTSSKSSQEAEAAESESSPHSSKGKGAHKTWHLFPKKHHQIHHKGGHKAKRQPVAEQKHSHKYDHLPFLWPLNLGTQAKQLGPCQSTFLFLQVHVSRKSSKAYSYMSLFGRWDIFPGVPTSLPKTDMDPKLQGSAYLAYLSNTDEARQSTGFDDSLAKTFDLQAHDAEM